MKRAILFSSLVAFVGTTHTAEVTVVPILDEVSIREHGPQFLEFMETASRGIDSLHNIFAEPEASNTGFGWLADAALDLGRTALKKGTLVIAAQFSGESQEALHGFHSLRRFFRNPGWKETLVDDAAEGADYINELIAHMKLDPANRIQIGHNFLLERLNRDGEIKERYLFNPAVDTIQDMHDITEKSDSDSDDETHRIPKRTYRTFWARNSFAEFAIRNLGALGVGVEITTGTKFDDTYTDTEFDLTSSGSEIEGVD